MYKKQIIIYQEFKSGESIKSLSKKYKVSKTEIECIIRYYLSPVRYLLTKIISSFLFL